MKIDNLKYKIKHFSSLWLILFIFIIILVLILTTIAKLSGPKINTEEGLGKLAYMEQQDINQIEDQIHLIEETELAEAEAWKNRTPNEKFANSIVLGDSITQGLYEYGVLDESLVIADRGTEVSKLGNSKIEEHISKVIDLHPQSIFLSYGLNDLSALQGNSDLFKENYKAIIVQLKEALPDTKLYINSILPVTQHAIDTTVYYENIPQFNEKLIELCTENNITFIDNTDLVKPEYYGSDGIHLSPSFYPDWVNHMAEGAEL